MSGDFHISGVTPANQTKERPVHELFPGAFRNKSSICESRLFSPRKNTRIHRKMGEIHMNFSFWPFAWFGLPGRLLNIEATSEKLGGRLLSIPPPNPPQTSQKVLRKIALRWLLFFFRLAKLNTNLLFSNFSGTAGIS